MRNPSGVWCASSVAANANVITATILQTKTPKSEFYQSLAYLFLVYCIFIQSIFLLFYHQHTLRRMGRGQPTQL